MINRVNLSFYLSRKRRNSSNLVPIWYRVTVNGERVDKSTSIYINPKHWDEKRKCITGGDSDVKLLNMRLQSIRNQMQVIHLKAEAEERQLSAHNIRLHVIGRPKIPTLIEAIDRQILQADAQKNHAYNTARSLKARKNLIVRYLTEYKCTKMLVSDISPQFAEKFKNWMLTQYSSAHTVKCLQLLKAAEYWAVYNEFIPAQRLGMIKVRHESVRERVFLSNEELCDIEKLQLECARLLRVKDLFLLQCYTGLAYTDLMDIDPSKLFNRDGVEYIKDKRIKSSQVALIPLFKKAKDILLKYGWALPFISLQKYNKYIKEIAGLAGIKRRLTSHSGRHTFGMLMLNAGYSIETVARMMGHSSIKTTERIYAQVNPTRVIQETLDLNMDVAKVA